MLSKKQCSKWFIKWAKGYPLEMPSLACSVANLLYYETIVIEKVRKKKKIFGSGIASFFPNLSIFIAIPNDQW